MEDASDDGGHGVSGETEGSTGASSDGEPSDSDGDARAAAAHACVYVCACMSLLVRQPYDLLGR